MNRLFSLVAIVGAMALGGCGFTPLYAAPGVNSGLSAIRINVPHGRTAFLLGEDLDDAFAHDPSAHAVYRLDVTVIEHTFSRGLNLANSAKYFENQVIVHYSLIELATGKVLKSSFEPVEVSYAAADQPYAGVAAQGNAQERAANEIAERIRIDIAGYFATKSPPAPPQ